MLQIIRLLRELNFCALMEVYTEDNLEKAESSGLGLNQGLLQAEQDFYQYLQECFFSVPRALYAVWEECGQYISAVRFEPYRDGFLLEALETAPEHRKKGYATKLIREALIQLQFEKVYSHISRRNIASLLVHERCGFKKIMDHAAYIDGSVNRNAVTMCWQRQESEAERKI